ncbi:MAG TPA: hypothetical protein VK050_00235 [Flavobacteriaceae bacterium]|nr:hypothetical protein [Flavobacteriaceae bacterium]
MKTLYKNIVLLVATAVLFASCSSDDNTTDYNSEENPITEKYLVYESIDEGLEWHVYSENKELEVGYNEFFVTIKEVETENYLQNVTIDWMPMMYMHGMAHSAPYSNLSNAENPKVYQGYVVFQMAGNNEEYWELDISYSVDGKSVERSIPIDVVQPLDGMVKTQSFVGNDEQNYVLAYVAPTKPEVATNYMLAVLYKMDDMHNFSIVENYIIALDPRMPGMGNHSSPNNKDLEYNSDTGFYEGKLSMTMTGYWRLNLQLLNTDGQVLKGEEITEEHPNSSLYFELEF